MAISNFHLMHLSHSVCAQTLACHKGGGTTVNAFHLEPFADPPSVHKVKGIDDSAS
jgi:hypothetical protein